METEQGWVKVFAPASIANLGPGFDALGAALEGLGDTIQARRNETPGVRIVEMTGEKENIPTDPANNCAGRAAESVLRQLKGKAAREAGLEMKLHKGLPQGSGLGSSAAFFTSAKPGISFARTGSTTRSTTARPKSATLPRATAAVRAAAFAQLPAASLRAIVSGRTERA